MQTQKLFTYAVLLHPTEAEKEDGGETKLIVPPTHDLAKDETTLRTKAALSIPKEYQDVLNRVEIIVRPF